MTEFIHPPKHPRPPHEQPERRDMYAAAVRRASIHEAIELIADERPGAAIRRMARAVEAQLAIDGYPGIQISVSASMARVAAAGHAFRMGTPKPAEPSRYELVDLRSVA